MEMLTWTFSTLTGSLLLGSFLWIFLWHWVRKKNERQWLPILQVFPIRSTRFLRVRFQPPPWVSFLCFVLLWALLALSAWEPSLVHLSSSPITHGKAVVYVDLTPSVSSVISISAYQNQLRKIRETLQQQAKLVWLNSWDQEARDFPSAAEFEAWVSKLSFQRTGRKIASVLQHHAAALRESQSLYVVSDRDAHSWSEFRWDFYGESMEVRYIPVETEKAGRQNFYFDSIAPVLSVDPTFLEWEVIIKSTEEEGEKAHILQVFQNETLLQEKEWKITTTTLQTKLHVSIPVRSIDRNQRLMLRWKLNVEDAIASDNEFLTPIQTPYQKALLVVRNEGEHFLSTSRSQLRAWLEVLGFEVDLVESLSQKNPSVAYSLAMILLPPDVDIKTQCPTADSVKGAKIWLLPYRAEQELDGLCWCYDQFLMGHSEKKPEYCSNLASSSDLNRSLFALGAQRVGGSVDNEAKSIAYVGKSGEQEILVFNRSFSKDPTASILSGRLPFLIQSILEWQQVLSSTTGKATNQQWPRLEDAPGGDAVDSNVAIGESRMEQIAKEELPAEFDFLHPLESMRGTEKEKNALPWIWIVSGLWMLLFGIEGVWTLLQRKKTINLSSVGIFFLLGLLLLPSISLIAAPIQLTLLSEGSWKPTFQELAKGISAKTSVELSESPKIFPTLQTEIYSEPWIWVKNIRSIQDAAGVLHRDVENWVRSGGLLILENASDLSVLQALTKNFEPNVRFPVEWNYVSMEHELMRSFYLLSSIPVCQDRKIMVFDFDKRMSILAIPFSLLEVVRDEGKLPACLASGDDRKSIMQFMINVLMVALTTDYKKDQLHMKEVLKRLK